MTKRKLLIYLFQLFFPCTLFALVESPPKLEIHEKFSSSQNEVVMATQRIVLEDFPKAYNPSIIETDFGLVLTFRYLPEPQLKPWISNLGAVILNESLEQISKPELVSTPLEMRTSPLQLEDARIFSYEGKIYVVYNDNIEVTSPNLSQRRDMFLAEITHDGQHFSTHSPIKLIHEQKYFKYFWQKNWVPFVWEKTLLFSYSIAPHEVVSPDLTTGICQKISTTPSKITWKYGTLRGGSPALLVDGEYLAFFHSSIVTRSKASSGKKMYHYYMGAYTFSSEPPFELTSYTPIPIDKEGFYVESDFEKRVIFPGSYFISENTIYLAYGKDDSEIWIAIINKDELKKTMVKINE